MIMIPIPEMILAALGKQFEAPPCLLSIPAKEWSSHSVIERPAQDPDLSAISPSPVTALTCR